MSQVHAYCRVSTTDQDATMQVEDIRKKFPNAVIHEEKASASSRDGRPKLELLLSVLREGDKLVVWKLDRLARNTLELLQIKDEIAEKGAGLVVLDMDIDTSTASGKCFLQMLAVFAEFETNLRKERQMAGIQQAKAEGKYKGRPVSLDKDAIGEMLADGATHSAIAKKLGISTKSVQRVRREIEDRTKIDGRGTSTAEARQLERKPLDH
ncbi:Site-specific DNA recombinase [Paucidesulfovibrio gracilis DSM 16080]|uniref:Site-specific DNA recombinase n=1 Tax=Paucidesulfovibrio gracilis DSM 16080 TaxID=1121449 RepID=A0A1T4W4D8_9BACT|nr:recombinase family protein [Paucidesulfovibrio gracilis]SKA72102.1 Site-specific DNA recombinase [Paucidesulfovibrio gracilis DSM 16080]